MSHEYVSSSNLHIKWDICNLIDATVVNYTVIYKWPPCVLFRYKLHEVLNLLEESNDWQEANIFLSVPGDGRNSDEDSADEESTTPSINSLSGNQLLASALATIRDGVDRHELGQDSEDLTVSDTVSDTVSEETVVDAGFAATNLSSSVDATEPLPSVRKRKSIMPVEATDVKKDTRTEKSKAPRSTIECTQSSRRQTTPRQVYWQKKKDLPESKPKVIKWKPSQRNYSNDSPTPSQLFDMFFDDELVQMISEETNRYAAQKGNMGFATDSDEIRVFVAILLLSGYIPLPRKNMFWEDSGEARNECVANAMRRNRFNEILHYLHLANNDTLSQSKLAKVLPYLAHLNVNFLTYFPAEQDLSIDESMIPYFGRHGSKQFIRNKPVRFGYKVWSLCTRLGYIVQFEPYEGKAAFYDKELGLGASVVMDLLSELPSNGYRVYCDNYFTTIKLFGMMNDRGMGLTGTIRANRIGNCPVDSKAVAKKDRGCYDYSYSPDGSVVVVCWNDNNVVTAASNCHGVHPLGKATRFSKAKGGKVAIDVPQLIKQYNTFMGGVDRFDQNVACYRCNIRSKKWWFPFFVFGLEAAMQNAFQLYRARKLDCGVVWDLLGFRRYVVQTYLKKYGNPPELGRPSTHTKMDRRVLPDVRYDGQEHWPSESATQRRCGQCGGKVRVCCMKCDVGLHIGCFKDYHSR